MSENNEIKIQYDVDLSFLHSQPDLCAVIQFLESEHTNMRVEYETKFECQKRRASIRTWLIKNGHLNISTKVRDNNLYIIKEQGEFTL